MFRPFLRHNLRGRRTVPEDDRVDRSQVLFLKFGQGVQKLSRAHNLRVPPTLREMLEVSSHHKVGLGGLSAFKEHIIVGVGTRPNCLRRLDP